MSKAKSFYANAVINRIFDFLLQAMINVWSTGEETSRVLSFLSIIRLVRLRQEDLLEKTLKVFTDRYCNTEFYGS